MPTMTMAKIRAIAMPQSQSQFDKADKAMSQYQYATQRQRRRPRPRTRIHTSILAFVLTAICLLLLPTSTNAFAAWFVDRRVSCLTDLAPNEIIMNNGVLPHSTSREPTIHLKVTPLGNENEDITITAKPDSEYVVKFVVPDDAKGRVSDVQYVLDITSDSPAKFTTAPSNGGVGCEDNKRSHGNAGGETAAIITIDADAEKGARVNIVAGWATGHEAVTLVETVTLIVGQGVVDGNDNEGSGARVGRALEAEEEEEEFDDALADDEAEAELEEAFIEEEREDLESEIEQAEEDAVEALEEKRQETDGSWEDINEAEEEIVEALEDNRKHVDQALNSLKEEIIINQSKKQMEKGKGKGKLLFDKHKHNMKERMEAQHDHRKQHERKHMEGRLDEMHRRFKKEHDNVRKDKLDKLIEMKNQLVDNVDKLNGVDKKEHEKARRKHIKPLSKEELKVDMEELKRKAKERMHLLSDRYKSGVNELMNEPHMKQIRDKLRDGNIRGGEASYHGDEGVPLPPEGRHFLTVMFGMFALVGLIRWGLDKRRRAALARKGRRNL